MNTVTKEEVMENMKDVFCQTLEPFEGKKLTQVIVKMKNGFTLVETSAPVDPNTYDKEIGKEICLKKIEDKIWYLLGYSLQDRLYKEKSKSK